jgi:hypothetical protein
MATTRTIDVDPTLFGTLAFYFVLQRSHYLLECDFVFLALVLFVFLRE